MNTKPDSLIFDMDGTLWDALDLYVASWNAGFKKEKVEKVISRGDLDFMMGWEKRKVLEHVLPDFSIERQEIIFKTIDQIRETLIQEMGGVLYEGVKEGLEKLSAQYKLYIVSNCPENLIKHFMAWAKISHLISDEMAHGVNGQPKHYNIKFLIEKHQLKNPIYIGDTETDSLESRKAGLPFVFMTYGFGKTEEYNLRFDNFKSLTDYFMKLN